MKKMNPFQLTAIFSLVLLTTGFQDKAVIDNNYPTARNSKIQPKLIRLPVGDIVPKGWLLDWANAAKNGIGGIQSKYYGNAWLNGQPNKFYAESGGYVIDG